jgi:hypothetical protein
MLPYSTPARKHVVTPAQLTFETPANEATDGLTDQRATLAPCILPKDFFIFSPFGLCCWHPDCQHRPQIQADHRSIRIHLKKHQEFQASDTLAILQAFRLELQQAQALGNIKPYLFDSSIYAGYTCICSQVFPIRRNNALRHCKNMNCDPEKIQKVDLFKLRCGRYVSAAQIDNVFAN